MLKIFKRKLYIGKNNHKNLHIHFKNDEDYKEFKPKLYKTFEDLVENDQMGISHLVALNTLIENIPQYKSNYKEECYQSTISYTNCLDFKVSDIMKSRFNISLCISDDEFGNHFRDTLKKNIDVNISKKTKTIWYPIRPKELYQYKNMVWSNLSVKNKYPIYVISKGRYDKRHTIKWLEWSCLDYKVVIEPNEFEEYSNVISKENILCLTDEYLNLNQGSIPARNFVIRHSRNRGDKYHWILDDNIIGYYRYYNSERNLIKGGVAFRAVEDFVDNFKNVGLAGHNYGMFCVSTNLSLKPYTLNTRIYSSILINNDIPYEWRGRYNEDTDLSLRVLKKGYTTVLFNSVLADKLTTLSCSGGNTDTIYNVKDFDLLKVEHLVKQHPDVKIVKKYNRRHHYYNYKVFKQNLVLKDGVKLKEKINNYGLELLKVDSRYKEDIYLT